MFKDEIKISVTAGRGGDGVIHWRHQKYEDKGGPDGGDGGIGGNIYIVAIKSLRALNKLKGGRDYKAEEGTQGGAQNKKGRNGKDLTIEVPLGSYIKNLKTHEEYECISENEPILIAAGGRGGFGNSHYKSGANTTPKKAGYGHDGQTYQIYIELRIIADVGIIGLPNAGKSTLLNEITNAHSKIGAYPFTTLEPSLGVAQDIVFADIPGIIEGASTGKGLGHKFLRHISRTKTLLHLVSLESDDLLGDYKTIRKELKQYKYDLEKKQEIVVLTKQDLVDEVVTDNAKKLFNKHNAEPVFVISSTDKISIKKLFDFILTKIQ